MNEVYRILKGWKVGNLNIEWSLHWSLPSTLEQAIKDCENLNKNDKNPLVVYKAVKITDIS